MNWASRKLHRKEAQRQSPLQRSVYKHRKSVVVYVELNRNPISHARELRVSSSLTQILPRVVLVAPVIQLASDTRWMLWLACALAFSPDLPSRFAPIAIVLLREVLCPSSRSLDLESSCCDWATCIGKVAPRREDVLRNKIRSATR